MSARLEGWLDAPGGVRLRTLAWSAERPVGRVIVVHGFGEHAGRYEELASILTRAGWSVLACDLRGHGASSGRRGVLRSFDLLLTDLAALREVLDERTPGPHAPVLLGHSLGGLVALRYLQRGGDPVRGLVLSAPWLATAARVPGWKRVAADVLARLAPDLTLSNGLSPEQLSRDPARVRAWRSDPLVHDRISGRLWREVRRAQEAALAAGPPSETATLILLPTADPVARAAVTEGWAARHDPADLEVRRLEGRLHEPFNDLGRGEVFDALLGWLGDRAAGQEPRKDLRVSSPTLRRSGPRRAPGGHSVPRETTRDP